jgi:hypothetical protein
MLEKVDVWILRIQKADEEILLPYELQRDIIRFEKDAFLFDFNLIIENFQFYQKLNPQLQNKLITTLFDEFIAKFYHFFENCQNGFRNELIINMYSRRHFVG